MKAYPYLPIFFILSYLGVTVSVIINDLMAPLIGVIVFGAGLAMYYFIKKNNTSS
jgi:hypothetical protein